MDQSSNNSPFAYDGLDRIFHEKARLGILTSLASQPDGVSFSQLRQLCGLTDGNLSRHIQVLEEANIVSVTKGFDKKRPLTLCSLTDLGRERFLQYLAILEQVLQGATRATQHIKSQDVAQDQSPNNQTLPRLKPA